MRAVCYERHGPADEVLLVGKHSTPQPGPGEVRLRLHASGAAIGRILAAVLSLALSPIVVAQSWAAPIPPGPGEQDARLGNTVLHVFTYRPDCPDPSVLLVFHGVSRNASGYRDHARPLADKLCMIVVAPLFDKERFPRWRYQYGGMVRRHAVQDPRDWTGRLVVDLMGWVRAQEGRNRPVFMIGHSAGGQFLSRVAAFVPTDAVRIVIANPSTHVLPTLETAAPFGFADVYSGAKATAELRRYLATPVTIFLGEEDVGDKELTNSPEARAQGTTRLERGRNTFQEGQRTAKANGWTFNWRLVELPGVGHSSTKMFRSEAAPRALAP
jgi:poly(3-hydroxybutyrate) depolymerase